MKIPHTPIPYMRNRRAAELFIDRPILADFYVSQLGVVSTRLQVLRVLRRQKIHALLESQYVSLAKVPAFGGFAHA